MSAADVAAEVPWACMFAVVMCFVQLQFRYCVPMMVTTLKIVETAAVVVLCRLWVHREDVSPDVVSFMRQQFSNFTEL